MLLESILFSLVILYIFMTILIYFFVVLFLRKSLISNDSTFNLTKKRKVCLIIAHPDDECMFFSAILRQLANKGDKFFILCLTSGNYYNQANLRVNELNKSCKHLLKCENLADVTVIDEPDKLPDSPLPNSWDLKFCQEKIAQYISHKSIDLVVTFDEFGISGHINHCSIGNLIRRLKKEKEIDCEIIMLRTINIFRKYSFICDIVPTIFSMYCQKKMGRLLAFNSFNDYKISFQSMLKHRSQLFWFRWLYILSSRYMFMNCLEIL